MIADNLLLYIDNLNDIYPLGVSIMRYLERKIYHII
jgi:hypothetical protein